MCTSIYKGEIEVFITLEIEKEEEKIICIKSPVDIAIDEGELIYLKNQDLIDEKKEPYEDGEEQCLVTIYKKDNILLFITFNASSEYFDILIDNVETILDSIEIYSGEK